jgi:flagellar basal body-associated protein FliL
MNQLLGKLLFPRLPPDLQRRKVNIILAVLLVCLLLGGLVALMAVLNNKVGPR